MNRPETPLPDPANAAQRFGSVLRNLRSVAGLTQTELARHADCDRSTIGQVERGEFVPSRQLVRAWEECMHAEDLLYPHWVDAVVESRERRSKGARGA